MRRLLGLNIGGTTCSAVVGNERAEVEHREAWATPPHVGPDRAIAQIIERAHALISQSGAVEAVGVAIGGPMDARTGTILGPPNLPGWDHVPLAEQLREALRLPVRVEHDAAACALAEYRWGAGQTVGRLAYLTCGTGFGVGLVIDGQAYYGAGGTPAEIGHIAYRDDGPEAFGKRGCFEAFASAAALQRIAAWRFAERWAADPPTPQQVSKLARGGDAAAMEVIAINARAVGDACALLIDLLCPDRILLGSAARYLGDQWIKQVRAYAMDAVGPWTRERFTITPAGLGERLQDCSALAAALIASNNDPLPPPPSAPD